ncbi:MAG TPA: hypothetical protein VLB27_00570 [candidate division Zixibacteria bacterium]|nr:hypothetical protein [candidate division Zixibacteria bacterium]
MLTRAKKIQFGAVLGGLLLALVTAGAPCAQSSGADVDQGLIDYYLQSARRYHETADIRRVSSPFTALVVIKRYLLNETADTLRLDTAVVRAYFTPARTPDLELDTLAPESVTVLRSSYSEGRPELTALFTPPPWERPVVYRLYPDDPTRPGQALGFHSDTALPSGLANGMMSVDRQSGMLLYDLVYYEQDNDRTRYSRETEYQELDGFLVPRVITEHHTERRFMGSEYFVVETRTLTLEFK